MIQDVPFCWICFNNALRSLFPFQIEFLFHQNSLLWHNPTIISRHFCKNTNEDISPHWRKPSKLNMRLDVFAVQSCPAGGVVCAHFTVLYHLGPSLNYAMFPLWGIVQLVPSVHILIYIFAVWQQPENSIWWWTFYSVDHLYVCSGTIYY